MGINQLGPYNRSFSLTSYSQENYYYAPYILGVDKVKAVGTDTFVRSDSIYSIEIPGQPEIKPESPDYICQTQQKNATHAWYLRTNTLNDPELIAEFNTINNYFGGNKPILVLTFFEAVSEFVMDFREDWYLMKDVGLVGIDQSTYLDVDESIVDAFYQENFLKVSNPIAKPHIRARATRGYIGEPLSVNFSPQHVLPGGTYTINAHSSNSGMPYDGYMQYDDNGTPRTWNLNGDPIWITNGQAQVTLPSDFPTGTYTSRFRSKITTTPSEHETQLPYDNFPWSNFATLHVVNTLPSPTPTVSPNPTPFPPYSNIIQKFNQQGSFPEDINNDGVVNIFDLNLLVQ